VTGAADGHPGNGHPGVQRAVPYVCPFCAEEDLRPADDGRWHCRSCLRLFSVAFHGLAGPGSTYPGSTYPGSTYPGSTCPGSTR
jgi:hypothetical protein